MKTKKNTKTTCHKRSWTIYCITDITIKLWQESLQVKIIDKCHNSNKPTEEDFIITNKIFGSIKLGKRNLIKILVTKILSEANSASHDQFVFATNINVEKPKTYANTIKKLDAHW